MARTRKTTTQARQRKETPVKHTTPKCLAIADKGIRTSQDFADYMSAMMTDVVTGAVTPQVTNAACNAGGKLLKAVELQMKYGAKLQRQPTIRLTSAT